MTITFDQILIFTPNQTNELKAMALMKKKYCNNISHIISFEKIHIQNSNRCFHICLMLDMQQNECVERLLLSDNQYSQYENWYNNFVYPLVQQKGRPLVSPRLTICKYDSPIWNDFENLVLHGWAYPVPSYEYNYLLPNNISNPFQKQ